LVTPAVAARLTCCSPNGQRRYSRRALRSRLQLNGDGHAYSCHYSSACGGRAAAGHGLVNRSDDSTSLDGHHLPASINAGGLLRQRQLVDLNSRKSWRARRGVRQLFAPCPRSKYFEREASLYIGRPLGRAVRRGSFRFRAQHPTASGTGVADSLDRAATAACAA
jgi:hypothetical protein